MKTSSRKSLRESIETIRTKGIGSAIGSGLTAKQKKFAEGLVIEGLTGADAYRRAYNTQASPHTVGTDASKLKSNPRIANEIMLLEQAKERAALHSAESLRSLVISTLTDVATNSDRDSVRVAAVKVLGTVVGVDAFRETKRVEHIQGSDQIKEQIMSQLKTMMLGTSEAETIDATDLLAELSGDSGDPTVPPPSQAENGTPADHVHSIPLEQSLSELEDPPIHLDNQTPPGDIFLEK